MSHSINKVKAETAPSSNIGWTDPRACSQTYVVPQSVLHGLLAGLLSGFHDQSAEAVPEGAGSQGFAPRSHTVASQGEH